MWLKPEASVEFSLLHNLKVGIPHAPPLDSDTAQEPSMCCGSNDQLAQRAMQKERSECRSQDKPRGLQ